MFLKCEQKFSGFWAKSFSQGWQNCISLRGTSGLIFLIFLKYLQSLLLTLSKKFLASWIVKTAFYVLEKLFWTGTLLAEKLYLNLSFLQGFERKVIKIWAGIFRQVCHNCILLVQRNLSKNSHFKKYKYFQKTFWTKNFGQDCQGCILRAQKNILRKTSTSKIIKF